ncbi:MAG: hypothetical protein HQK96_18780 [Nitrospirae bacterium]|nr:hypothetical protein [Nitrospirota bacterium]
MADSFEIDSNKVEEDVRLRRSIMKIFYDEYKDNPGCVIDLDKIAEMCSVDKKEVIWNSRYLHESGYIACNNPRMPKWAMLTSLAVDIVENRKSFDGKFPMQMNQNINIFGDNTAPIQGHQSEITNTQYNINKFFTDFSENIKNAPIPEGEKSSLLEKIKEFSSHPVVSDILSTLIISSGFKYLSP